MEEGPVIERGLFPSLTRVTIVGSRRLAKPGRVLPAVGAWGGGGGRFALDERNALVLLQEYPAATHNRSCPIRCTPRPRGCRHFDEECVTSDEPKLSYASPCLNYP